MHCGVKVLPPLMTAHPAGEPAGTLSVTLLLSRKSPCSSALLGMVTLVGLLELRTYFHCSPTKKKILSRLIGPPSCQDGLLKRSSGVIGFPLLSLGTK